MWWLTPLHMSKIFVIGPFVLRLCTPFVYPSDIRHSVYPSVICHSIIRHFHQTSKHGFWLSFVITLFFPKTRRTKFFGEPPFIIRISSNSMIPQLAAVFTKLKTKKNELPYTEYPSVYWISLQKKSEKIHAEAKPNSAAHSDLSVQLKDPKKHLKPWLEMWLKLSEVLHQLLINVCLKKVELRPVPFLWLVIHDLLGYVISENNLKKIPFYNAKINKCLSHCLQFQIFSCQTGLCCSFFQNNSQKIGAFKNATKGK